MVTAELVSVGSEICRGEIVDTNAAFLASQLCLLGINVRGATQVGDDLDRLTHAIRLAWQRSDLVLTTGGLGPTQDDLTREAIAAMLGEKMQVDPTLEQELRATLSRFGRQMPSSNLKQATLVPSAQAIPNPRGTAPGWWVQQGEHILLAMPGPPTEMERMWRKEILPRLRQAAKGLAVATRTVKLYGLSEAAAGEMASPVFDSGELEVGIYAKPDGIQLRLVSRAATQEQADATLGRSEAKLLEIFKGHIWGMDEASLEDSICSLLAGCGLTLATIESSTGGALASLLCNGAQSDSVYKGGLVLSPAELEKVPGFDSRLVYQYGAASSEVAVAMAAAARRNLGSDIGLAVGGVIGPQEREDSSVFIAVEAGQRLHVRQHSYRRNFAQVRAEARRRAAITALFQLREALLSGE